MKKLIGLVLFLAGGWIFVRGVAAAEVINQFDSQITINSDTSLTIEETIAYQTDEVHHGIYRYIPLKYRVDNLVVEAPVTVLAITDETGQSYQYQSNRENNQLTVKIGDPETTFTGEKTYLIKYRVEEAIKQFEDHDELYWDITGEGWQIPIETVTASVKSPAATLTKAVCYAGPIGNDDGLCQTDLSDQVARFKYEAGINYDRNVTVAVALGRPNQLLFPTATQRLVKQLSNNWFVPMLFVPLLFMAGYWLLNGRDYVFISPNVFNLHP